MTTVNNITKPRFDNDPRWVERLMQLLSYQTYAGDPTSNTRPRWVGDRCLDTTNDDWYMSYGTENTEWKIIT